MTKHDRLSSLGEFGWLKQLLPRLYWPASLNSQLCIGPGDDAGVLGITPKRVLVATTDAMIEGVHFERRWFSWRDLGEKLLAINLSDLAAMGRVKPLAALVTAALPGDTTVDSVNKFYLGLNTCAQRWKTGFLGGDTVGSKRDWFVSATLLGEADPKELVGRGGAQEGDLLAVIGPLGWASAGLEVLQTGKKSWPWTRPLVQAFCRPVPRFAAGALLGGKQLATSLIDASDGLEASVRLLAEASKLGAELDLDSVPVAPALKRWAEYRQRKVWEYVLRGGEDYALIFTVTPSNWHAVKRQLPDASLIGRMVSKKLGSYALLGKKRSPLKSYGYSHFKK